MSSVKPLVVHGDLIDQPVEVLVNAWNRNILPWWLLIPQGVAGALRRRAGTAPFRELAKMGTIPVGGAVLTGPGKLPCRGLIHVAGINLLWCSSEEIVRLCVTNAMDLVNRHNFASVAFPLIGASTGGLSPERSRQAILETLAECHSEAEVRLVLYEPGK